MRVYKSINNNIVSAFDEKGREVVLIGRGIGFKAREGEEIPRERIEKVFVMSNPDNTSRLISLFESLPAEYIELTHDILTYAKEHLRRRLNESAYFTLADHINFAVMRHRQGMDFQNVLLAEVRSFYTQEYQVGLYALELMEERLGVSMPEDEAASIALHIFNAEYDISISDAFHATQLLNEILEMVRNRLGIEMTAQDYYCERFLTHLKFLTQRVIKGEPLPEGGGELYPMLADRYPKEMGCAQAIAAHIGERHRFSLPREELSDLAIHLKRTGGKTRPKPNERL